MSMFWGDPPSLQNGEMKNHVMGQAYADFQMGEDFVQDDWYPTSFRPPYLDRGRVRKNRPKLIYSQDPHFFDKDAPNYKDGDAQTLKERHEKWFEEAKNRDIRNWNRPWRDGKDPRNLAHTPHYPILSDPIGNSMRVFTDETGTGMDVGTSYEMLYNDTDDPVEVWWRHRGMFGPIYPSQRGESGREEVFEFCNETLAPGTYSTKYEVPIKQLHNMCVKYRPNGQFVESRDRVKYPPYREWGTEDKVKCMELFSPPKPDQVLPMRVSAVIKRGLVNGYDPQNPPSSWRLPPWDFDGKISGERLRSDGQMARIAREKAKQGIQFSYLNRSEHEEQHRLNYQRTRYLNDLEEERRVYNWAKNATAQERKEVEAKMDPAWTASHLLCCGHQGMEGAVPDSNLTALKISNEPSWVQTLRDANFTEMEILEVLQDPAPCGIAWPMCDKHSNWGPHIKTGSESFTPKAEREFYDYMAQRDGWPIQEEWQIKDVPEAFRDAKLQASKDAILRGWRGAEPQNYFRPGFFQDDINELYENHKDSIIPVVLAFMSFMVPLITLGKFCSFQKSAGESQECLISV